MALNECTFPLCDSYHLGCSCSSWELGLGVQRSVCCIAFLSSVGVLAIFNYPNLFHSGSKFDGRSTEQRRVADEVPQDHMACRFSAIIPMIPIAFQSDGRKSSWTGPSTEACTRCSALQILRCTACPNNKPYKNCLLIPFPSNAFCPR